MSFNRPPLANIIRRVREDTLSRLSNDNSLRRSDAEVYARVIGGASHEMYGFIDWLSKQLIYDTAENEYLERWCSIWGIQRKPGGAASGTAEFKIQAGAVIPESTLLKAPDGTQYETTEDASLTGLSASAPIVALEPGASGNREAGETLSLVSPLIGVQADATASLISGGADEESDDALRARLLMRIQQPPHGGAKDDYVRRALEVPGVTRAWAYPCELGLGTVTVRFVRDNDGQGAAIIPSDEEVAKVQAYIDERCPVTAQLTVVAPVPVPVNFSIDLIPSSEAVRASVEAELQDLLIREAIPGGPILRSHITAAISAASGEIDNTLIAPLANITNPTGHMSIMGEITWV